MSALVVSVSLYEAEHIALHSLENMCSKSSIGTGRRVFYSFHPQYDSRCWFKKCARFFLCFHLGKDYSVAFHLTYFIGSVSDGIQFTSSLALCFTSDTTHTNVQHTFLQYFRDLLDISVIFVQPKRKYQLMDMLYMEYVVLNRFEKPWFRGVEFSGRTKNICEYLLHFMFCCELHLFYY